MPPQRILAPYKLFHLFCRNHIFVLFVSLRFSSGPVAQAAQRLRGVGDGPNSYWLRLRSRRAIPSRIAHTTAIAIASRGTNSQKSPIPNAA